MITLIKSLFSASLGWLSWPLELLAHWKLIALVLALGGVGFEGYHLAKSWDREATLVAQAETMKQRLGTITLLQASDAKRAQADTAQINKLKEVAIETPPNPRPGLDHAAVSRLRAIR